MKARAGTVPFLGGQGGVVTMVTSGCAGEKQPVLMNVLASPRPVA